MANKRLTSMEVTLTRAPDGTASVRKKYSRHEIQLNDLLTLFGLDADAVLPHKEPSHAFELHEGVRVRAVITIELTSPVKKVRGLAAWQ